MKLANLTIKMNQWGPNEGRYTGEVRYQDEGGEVMMVLSPDVSAVVLAAVGKNIVQLTQTTANDLARSIEQSVIEAKAAPTLTA